jgi:hypothetical protein
MDNVCIMKRNKNVEYKKYNADWKKYEWAVLIDY